MINVIVELTLITNHHHHHHLRQLREYYTLIAATLSDSTYKQFIYFKNYFSI